MPLDPRRWEVNLGKKGYQAKYQLLSKALFEEKFHWTPGACEGYREEKGYQANVCMHACMPWKWNPLEQTEEKVKLNFLSSLNFVTRKPIAIFI